MFSMVLQIFKIASAAQAHADEPAHRIKTGLERLRRRDTHLTTIGTSVFSAQTRATTHPIIVQPRKKFSSRIAVVSRLFLAKARIVGRKYITNPKPMNGKKKIAGTIIRFPPQALAYQPYP
jgi:hypothetical protein